MKVLVTGAGGFLGSAISRQLLARGDSVKGLARSSYPELEEQGVEMLRGDVADPGAVVEAVEGCDLVMHVAAKAGVWGDRKSYWDPNVVGTRNVIGACRQAGVNKLVYTSTPSVTYVGTDENGIDESTPYSDKPLCHYAATKIIAEREVLEANKGALSTVALRPHLIWGPGDTNLVPRVVERARTGRLKFVGEGDCLVDSVYIDNAATAHILAADRIGPGASCAGKPYFITNDEPLPMADLLNRIVKAAGLPPVRKSVPAGLAYIAGAMMEGVFGLLRQEEEPLMTRFVARQLSTAHWFDISAAKRDLGYEPEVSIDEGMERLARELRS